MTYFLSGVPQEEGLNGASEGFREGRGERSRRKMDWSSEITGIFIKFCLGERRFTKSEMKGKSAWGPGKIIVFHARFSSPTEHGLQIRKLWLEAFVNSAGCQMLVPGWASDLPEQQRESCGAARSGLQDRLPALQAHLTCQLLRNCLFRLFLGLVTQQILVQLGVPLWSKCLPELHWLIGLGFWLLPRHLASSHSGIWAPSMRFTNSISVLTHLQRPSPTTWPEAIQVRGYLWCLLPRCLSPLWAAHIWTHYSHFQPTFGVWNFLAWIWEL